VSLVGVEFWERHEQHIYTFVVVVVVPGAGFFVCQAEKELGYDDLTRDDLSFSIRVDDETFL
jgi:hypothetical protein